MRVVKFCLLLGFFLWIQNVSSQIEKFGKVSEEILTQDRHPLHPEADAAFLFRDIRVYYIYVKDKGFVQNTEVHERVKIYNNTGFDWATHQVRYYVGGNTDQSVTRIKGATYNLENGKVQTTKLEKDGIFDEAYNKFWNLKKLALPKVKAGSVIEYKYVVSSDYIGNIREILLQQTVPIDYESIRFEIPEFYVFRPYVRGDIVLNPQTKKGTRTESFALGAKTVGSGLNARTVSGGQSKFTYEITTTEYELNNVSPLRDEPYVDNLFNYIGAINMELQYTNYPNSGITEYISSWESESNTIFQDYYKDYLNKRIDLGSDLDGLLVVANSDKEKLNLIFEWAKNKIKWNGEYGIFPEESLKEISEKGSAPIAELNLLLVKALEYAGLESYPVLVSTKEHGVPLFPTLEGFNYVIAAVVLDGGLFLMDASSPASLPNMLPERVMNWQGRLLMPDGASQFVSLTPNYLSSHVVNLLANLDDTTDAVGQAREQFTNHFGLEMRSALTSDTADEYLSEFDNGDFFAEAISLKNYTELADPLILSYEFTIEDAIEDLDGKRYFNPYFHLGMTENPFQSDTRSLPVDYVYPKEHKFMISVTIPEGYQIESVPPTVNIALPEGLGSYSAQYRVSNNTVAIRSSLKLNTGLFGAQLYTYLKQFMSQVVENQKERIVLIKS